MRSTRRQAEHQLRPQAFAPAVHAAVASLATQAVQQECAKAEQQECSVLRPCKSAGAPVSAHGSRHGAPNPSDEVKSSQYFHSFIHQPQKNICAAITWHITCVPCIPTWYAQARDMPAQLFTRLYHPQRGRIRPAAAQQMTDPVIRALRPLRNPSSLLHPPAPSPVLTCSFPASLPSLFPRSNSWAEETTTWLTRGFCGKPLGEGEGDSKSRIATHVSAQLHRHTLAHVPVSCLCMVRQSSMLTCMHGFVDACTVESFRRWHMVGTRTMQWGGSNNFVCAAGREGF